MPFCSLEGRAPHHEPLIPPGQELVGDIPTPGVWQVT